MNDFVSQGTEPSVSQQMFDGENNQFLPVSRLGLVATACLIAIILCVSGLYVYQRHLLNQSAAAVDEASLDSEEIRRIVYRGSDLLGQTSEPQSWIAQIESGLTGLDDYLMRLFVSPGYLRQQADDTQFIRDLYQIIIGRPATDSESASLAGDETVRYSRLSMINKGLKQNGYVGDLAGKPSASQLKSVAISGDLPQSRTDVIGQMPLDLTVQLTGSDVVFRLFVNEQIHERQVIRSDTEHSDDSLSLIWDTQEMQPGQYELAVLGIGSDGRGQWLNVDAFNVPVVQTLKLFDVQASQETAWFQMPLWSDDTIRLTIPQASEPMAVDLFTAWDEKKASTAAGPQQPGALFFRPDASEDQATAYVRVRPEQLETVDEMHYTLVVSPITAVLPGNPDTYLSVIDQNADTLTVQNAAGQQSQINSSDIMLIDPAARLSQLQLNFSDGEATGMLPAFDHENDLYALYVTPQTDTLWYQAVAMEGSAALLETSLAQSQDGSQVVTASGELSLENSINILTFSVTGFDQTQKTYTIHILRPPDENGFHEVLDDFPLTWRTSLFWIHTQYPAYQFEAQATAIDWTDFIDAQDERDRTLIDANTVPESWVEAGSPVYDGSSWKAADRQVIAYYADPRNFLDPVNIFQFEKLTFLQTLHTHEGIEQIIEGTFMESGQSTQDYAGMILEAGQDADISPFFLASRIIQEMGRQAQSPLATGTLEGYEGVYNFYNIGSYPDPEVPNGAQINGARYALFGADPQQGEITEEEAAFLLPWTTPQRAITGGARWIAQRYVAIGQDTLYGQKFDLVADGGLFIHQYAQNIQMAWAEGRRTRNAWFDLGLIQESFVFRIPVFENMPETPNQLP